MICIYRWIFVSLYLCIYLSIYLPTYGFQKPLKSTADQAPHGHALGSQLQPYSAFVPCSLTGPGQAIHLGKPTIVRGNFPKFLWKKSQPHLMTLDEIHVWLVGQGHPSEQYEFVNWDDDIPNISGKIKNHPN